MGLRGVERHSATTSYEPDSIVRQFLQAEIDSSRVIPLTGPELPALDVEWRFIEHKLYYPIYSADPNIGFNCGWHCDHDHPDLGPVYFQYEYSVTGERDHEHTEFEKTFPTELL